MNRSSFENRPQLYWTNPSLNDSTKLDRKKINSLDKKLSSLVEFSCLYHFSGTWHLNSRPTE
jgi:hypothetical protein